MDELTLFLGFGAIAVTLLAGFVKGAVGFAMPTVMISGLASFLPVETALAALIMPTLVTNLWQAARQGLKLALESVKKFRVYLSMSVLFTALGAQMVRILSQEVLFLLIGVPVVLFALLQLFSVRFRVPERRRTLVELLVGSGAGTIGGISGVWGPPLVAYLTAINTPKQEQMRVQGLVFGLGAVALALGHIKSGVLSAATFPLSMAMLVPAIVGMVFGLMLHDRLPQQAFRRATLVVLALAGLNLIRRGLMG